MRVLSSSIAIKTAIAVVLLTGSTWSLQADEISNRWISIGTATVGVRSAYERDLAGVTTANQMQYRDALEGSLFFDSEHRYSLSFAAGTGDAFPGGWSNTSVGMAPGSSASYLKLLYLDAKPTSSLEIQWGGIGIEHGASTAITSYSNDGFMAGERLYVHDSRHLIFDTVAFTFGYLGDVQHPDIWDRSRRLWQNNYQQYLISKRISRRITTSADYTILAGSHTVREAVDARVPELKLIDGINVDAYERTNRTAAVGGNIAVRKSLNKTFTVGGGYAAIDRNYGDLNDDAFFHGRRVYLTGTVHILHGLNISPMFDHAIGNSYYLPNNTHFHLALTYDLLAMYRERASHPQN